MKTSTKVILLLLLATTPVYAQQSETETTRVDDGVYQFRYRGHNTFFVVTSER